jgi:hypothetical protein
VTRFPITVANLRKLVAAAEDLEGFEALGA